MAVIKRFKNPHHPDKEELETYVIIQDDRGFHEVRPRCLGNFKNYTMIGVLERGKQWETYSLGATENLPEYYVSVIYSNCVEDIPKHYGEILDFDIEEISKAIKIRAKDLRYE